MTTKPRVDGTEEPRGFLSRVLADDRSLCRFLLFLVILNSLGIDAPMIIGLVTGAPSIKIVSASTPAPSPSPSPSSVP